MIGMSPRVGLWSGLQWLVGQFTQTKGNTMGTVTGEVIHTSEDLAKIEVFKLLREIASSGVHFTRAPMWRVVKTEDDKLFILNALGEEICRAKSWGELLAQMTVKLP